MRYSKLFGKTIKEVPSDIKATSHKLLYKGGFIRELTSGRYEMLPLGFKVYERIIKIIQEEMEAIDSQRVVTPTLHPKAVWQKTGRDEVWGKDLLSVKDLRDGQEFTLSATAEGLFTEMVGKFNPSYKDLPIYVHQFSQKFRNEKRPRGGLLRLREFLMKDAYSFDTDDEAFKKTYWTFYKAYEKCAERLDLKAVAVEADNGALGGEYSHEFMIVADFGEDKIAKCSSCDYAANVEKGEFEREVSGKGEKKKKFEVVDLPYEVAKIKELMKHYNLPANRFIKNVVYKSTEGQIIIAIVTGDLEVNKVKLMRALKLEGDITEASPEDLASFGAKSGFVHSWGYKDKRIIMVADESIVKAINLYGGYKTDTTDPINVNYNEKVNDGATFKADMVADIAEAYEGAECKKCHKGKLNLVRAVEFGHVFQYGDFYSKAHEAYFVDKDGKKKFLKMGAYGIGIDRTIAIIVETHNDDKGIIWPKEIAPFQVHLISLRSDDKAFKEAEKLYDQLVDQGIDVLWDEREEVSAGEKFADADLIGIPLRVVVSEKSLENGGVEIKKRNEKESKIIKMEEISQYL